MPKVHITDSNLPKLRGDGDKEVNYSDTKLPGFTLRVSRNGARTFVLRYTSPIDSKQRRYRIGSVDSMTARRARDTATELVAELRDGVDPQADKVEAKGAWTCDQMIDAYLAELDRLHEQGQRSHRTISHYRGYIHHHIRPILGKRPVASVDLALVNRVLDDTNGPIARNRCLSVLRNLFQLAVDHGHLERLPTDGAKRNTERARETYLSVDEMKRIGAALDAMQDEGGNVSHIEAIRLLMLTGCRRREITNLLWDEVDLDKGELQLTRFKGVTRRERKVKVVVLSPPAIAVLERMTTLRVCEYVFPARKGKGTGWTHASEPSGTWKTALKRAGVSSTTRLHDLRHSFGAALVAAGVHIKVVSALLGHASLASTMRYLHADNTVMRDATTTVGATIGDALGIDTMRDAAE